MAVSTMPLMGVSQIDTGGDRYLLANPGPALGMRVVRMPVMLDELVAWVDQMRENLALELAGAVLGT
jgi:hypothetical protein